MNLDEVCSDAVNLILSAIYPKGDTSLSKFFYDRPGIPPLPGPYRAEIFVNRQEYLRAILFVRQTGAKYLRAISIANLGNMLTDFLRDNYWHIRDIRSDEGSYGSQVCDAGKLSLADALGKSSLFCPKQELTIHPLVPIKVINSFETSNFFLVSAEELGPRHFPAGISLPNFNAFQSPPIGDLDWKRNDGVQSWIGIRSPIPVVSEKICSAILGAIALTPIPRERHQFSGRKNFGGACTIDAEKYSISGNSKPLVPAMMNDIVLTTPDHAWLNVLAQLFESNDTKSSAKRKSLEYFYRAWSRNERERFPIFCMAIDSLVAANSMHTKAAIAYIKDCIGKEIDDERLKLLLRIRGAVIHGAAPDVYDAEGYEKYYTEYNADPIRDLELIVSKCLRKTIFDGTLKYHPDPNAELFATLRAQGKFPANLDEECIIPQDI